jgi:hypothetical protein
MTIFAAIHYCRVTYVIISSRCNNGVLSRRLFVQVFSAVIASSRVTSCHSSGAPRTVTVGAATHG